MDSLPTFDDDDEQALFDSVIKYQSVDGVIKPTITHTTTYANSMIFAEKKLTKLAVDKDDKINPRRYSEIFTLINHETMIRHYFPVSEFSPYVELCFKISDEDKDKIKTGLEWLDIETKQEILEKLRTDLRSDRFRKAIERKKKAISKNKQSLLRYINALFEYRSRLLIIRLDLSYESNTERKDKYKSHTKDEIDSWGQTARTHRNILIKKLGKQFKESFIGYVWKLEYGKDKGFHYHMIFFLDGSTCREDITIAKAIGELWKTEITHGEGVYWYLNADKKRFEINNRVATGMIHYKDIAMRNNLVRMATYLIKPDYFVRTVLPDGARTFQTGGKPKKIKAGRPRN